MDSENWQVGTLVEHPKRPEWGPGKIVYAEPERIHVVWRDLPDRLAKKLIRSAVVYRREQSDSVLDNLPPLVLKDGNMILPAERIPFQHAVDRFLATFPQGFYDPDYLGDLKVGERAYKWNAHEYFVSNLGGSKLREGIENDLPETVRLVQSCISKVNLLASFEQAAFRDALVVPTAAKDFLSRLADLLDSSTINGKAFEPYAEAVSDLPAARGRVASWPVATILPFLAQPDRHILLKPEITKIVADSLGFELNYRPEPNWKTYQSLLRMAEIYREKLAALKPRDLIDVQSFFWVACRGRY